MCRVLIGYAASHKSGSPSAYQVFEAEDPEAHTWRSVAKAADERSMRLRMMFLILRTTSLIGTTDLANKQEGLIHKREVLPNNRIDEFLSELNSLRDMASWKLREAQAFNLTLDPSEKRDLETIDRVTASVPRALHGFRCGQYRGGAWLLGRCIYTASTTLHTQTFHSLLSLSPANWQTPWLEHLWTS